jgi:hypothetical protein
LLEELAKGFLWNLPVFDRHIQFDVLHGSKMNPLEAHFQCRKKPSNSERDPESTVVG